MITVVVVFPDSLTGKDKAQSTLTKLRTLNVSWEWFLQNHHYVVGLA